MAVVITQTFYPKTREQWRKWLAKNHANTKEVWLIYYKNKTGKPTISYQTAVEEALCFGWIDGMDKSIDEQRYAQRFTPRKNKSHWTEGNIQRYQKLLEEDLVTNAGKKAFEERYKV